MVLGLPRGGIPVAAPIAERLGAGLWALPVRKISAPGRPELAMGAVAAIGDRVELYRNLDLIDRIGVSDAAFERRRAVAESELGRAVARYGGAPELHDRPVVVVDDGLATGATMVAAVLAVRSVDPTAITVAVPVASRAAVAALGRYATVVCPSLPEPFFAVGQAYRDFAQVADDEVAELLAR